MANWAKKFLSSWYTPPNQLAKVTSFTPGARRIAVPVGEGQGLDQRDLVDDQEPVGPRHLHARH